jgi:uncharacterized protein with HEPN domain
MNAKSPLAPVEHMLDCAKLATSYLEGLEKGDFLRDTRTQQAVIMNLLIIGEMASRLAPEHPDFRKEHPETPWRNMTAMRNRIAHGYFELDLDIVWDTVLTALPELVYRLQPIRDEIAATGGPREISPSDEI